MEGVVTAPAVTVLMAFYRGEKFIRAAIESVLAQTFTDWEFLLVDDAGGDGSAAIVDGFAAEHPGKIRRLAHPGGENRGPSASRNLGLREARGRHIAFIDQDDVWVKAKLEEQVAILDAEPRAGMVFGPAWVWYSWSGDPADRARDMLQPAGFPADTLVAAPWMVCLFLANRLVIPSPSGILVRKSAADAVGGFEDVFRGIYEDKVFYVKLGLKFPIYFSRRCWYWYRRHVDSALVVASDQGRYFKLWLEFLAWVARYVREQGLESEALARVLDRQVTRDSRFRWTVALGKLPGAAGAVKWLMMRVARKLVPPAMQARLAAMWQASYLSPPLGGVRFGDLDEARPISPLDGLDRGTTIERALVNRYLGRHVSGLSGAVCEWPDHALLARLKAPPASGPPEDAPAARATALEALPAGQLDALVMPHVLQHEYEPAKAVAGAHRALKDGGVLLATLPCLAPAAHYDADRPADYWRFTADAARRLFGDVFGAGNVTVEPLGSARDAVAAIHGLAAEELPGGVDDAAFPVVIGVRAVKRGAA